jgi:hypothetical protein
MARWRNGSRAAFRPQFLRELEFESLLGYHVENKGVSMYEDDEDIEEQFESVRQRVNQEGFDYAFRYYSNFDEVEDECFHFLRRDYVEAANSLAAYIGLEE